MSDGTRELRSERWLWLFLTGAAALGCGSGGPSGVTTPSAALRCGDDQCSEGEEVESCPTDCLGLQWVTFDGGAFVMGSADGPAQEQPRHEVTLEGFQLMQREATVAEYRACVNAGHCTPPFVDASDELLLPMYCSWGHDDREDHPVNCIDWGQADDFCRWVGGRLPTEAEWEYAARSAGQEQSFPWGEARPSCARAVMGVEPHYVGCREERTAPVCSKSRGQTAQGLCDMAGNVMEWVEDEGHDSYQGAPTNGGAWVDADEPETRVARGGSLATRDAAYLRTTVRFAFDPDQPRYVVGVRCAR